MQSSFPQRLRYRPVKDTKQSNGIAVDNRAIQGIREEMTEKERNK